MNGVTLCATAMASSAGLKATPVPAPVGKVLGLANFVPKPAPLQGYAVIKGVTLCATAMTLPVGLKATPLPEPVGSVAGSESLVPQPVALKG